MIRALSGSTLGVVRRAVLSAGTEANVVLVRGPASAIRFPAICPSCGRPADSSIKTRRGFRYQRDGDEPENTIQSIDEFEVPFCGACVARHQSHRKDVPWWTPVIRIFSDGQGLGGAIVLVIGFLFLLEAIKKMSLTVLVFLAGPALLAGGWCWRSVWRATPLMAVSPPEPVELAVDFTPILSLPYEEAWRAFQFQSAGYAAQFRDANAHQLWSGKSQEARAAAVQRRTEEARTNRVVMAVIAAILLWALVSEVILPFFSGSSEKFVGDRRFGQLAK